MKINIADMIYILDIQHKNQHIRKVMEKYGIDHPNLTDIQRALKRGRWNVVGQGEKG